MSFPAFVPLPWASTVTPALDWLYSTGSHTRALAYSQLFWPEFIEIEGCILLAGSSPNSYTVWLEHTHGDKGAVEATLNHRHIADLFHTTDEPSHDILIALGRILRDSWLAKLRQDFPDRQFVVTFSEDPAAMTSDYEITFYQVHRSA